MGAKKFWQENIIELQNINAEKAHKQEDLVPRSAKDSVQEVIIPLGNLSLHYVFFLQRNDMTVEVKRID